MNFLGPPEAPTNCSVVNQTTDSLVVECLPSFDGGLKQFFGLEVTDLQSGALTANFTDTLPEFQVRKPKTKLRTDSHELDNSIGKPTPMSVTLNQREKFLFRKFRKISILSGGNLMPKQVSGFFYKRPSK